MKRLLAFFTLLLFVVGCTKEVDISLPSDDTTSEVVKFNALVEDMTQTKATLINSWSGGEEVALFVDETLYRYTIAADGTMSGVEIIVDRADVITYKAYYPYDDSFTTIAEYEAACEVGSIDYMSAATTTSGKEVQLQFEHSMAALSFIFLFDGTVSESTVSLTLDGKIDNMVAIESNTNSGLSVSVVEANYFVEDGTDISSAYVKVEYGGMSNVYSLEREDSNVLEVGKQCLFTFTIGELPTGTGIETDPYIIYTAEDMRKVGTDPDGWSLSSHYRLACDIDLGGVEFTTIGSSSSSSSVFSGTFDGAEHEISGLNINQPSSDYQALFGFITGATIKNLSVSGRVVGNMYVGGIAGRINSDSKVEDCCFTGSIEASGDYTGGIVGCNYYSTVSDCANFGSVETSGNYAGGIMGYNNNSTVSDCANSGSVEASDNYVGGIAGYNYYSTISDCTNLGLVETPYGYIGGIVGDSHFSTVTNCSNTGTVKGSLDESCGGIVGYLYRGTVSRCYNTGSVYGGARTGGIIGYAAGVYNGYSTLSDCYNTGSVDGSSYVGGIVGRSSYITASCCYSIGSLVSSSSNVGGVIGFQSPTSTVSYFYYDSDVVTSVSGAVNGGNDGTNYCGLTTEMMKGDASTEGTLLYYFTNGEYANSTSWAADTEGVNNGYPVLIIND